MKTQEFLSKIKVVYNRFWFRVLLMGDMGGLILLFTNKMYVKHAVTAWKLDMLLDDLRDEDPVDMGINTYNTPFSLDYFEKYLFFSKLSHLIDNHLLGVCGRVIMWLKGLRFKHQNKPQELRARSFARRLAKMEKYEALAEIEKELNTRFVK